MRALITIPDDIKDVLVRILLGGGLIYLVVFIILLFYNEDVDKCLGFDLNKDLYCLNFVPILRYKNAELDKKIIVKENRGKSGIYRWLNTVNGKTYIGSSVNLTIRFNVYFNKNRLTTGSGSRMAINKAILKYGLGNFSLEILEYCDKRSLIKREQFYLDNLKPEYNLLKVAGSNLGNKHSMLTRKMISDSALGRTFSKETRIKISDALKGRILSEETKIKIKNYKHTQEAKLKISLNHHRTKSVKIEDLLSKNKTIFNTMTLAATYLNTTTATIGRYIKNQKAYKNRYLITVVIKK